MKKKIILFLSLLLGISSCSSQKRNVNQLATSSVFGKIENNKMVVLADTLALKERLNKNLFDEPIVFDAIEIKKQITIGDNPKEFYYVIIRNNKMHLKIVRWLKKVDNQLFLNNKSNGEDSFELMYQICIGEENCDPEVFDFDKERFWSCSKDPTCKIEPIDAETQKCRGMKSIIIDEIEN